MYTPRVQPSSCPRGTTPSARRRQFHAAIAAALVVWLCSPSAHAQQATGADTASGTEAELGRLSGNLKIGPSFGLMKRMPTQFSMQLDAGWAPGGGPLSVTFSPQLGLGDAVLFALPVGAQYDLRVGRVGPGEVVAYPRVNLGYARFTSGRGENAFTVASEAGAKYVLGHFSAGLEPLSIALYAGDFDAMAAWRIYAYGGATF